MQLTRFDRWLREKFVHETHVYTMRPLERGIPRGVHGFALAEKSGRRFRHRYITRSTKAADRLVRLLKEENMMFTTRIVNRKAWHVRLLAPVHHSPTWWLFSAVVILLLIASATYGVFLLWSNPDIREALIDSVRVLRR